MASIPWPRLIRETDGALTVRFHAGGVQEMCWHLFTWGTTVTIVAPCEFRAAMVEMALDVARHHMMPTVPSEQGDARPEDPRHDGTS